MNEETKPPITLLPCPFCGGEAARIHVGYVECTKCDAYGPTAPGGNDVTANVNSFGLWNTRVSADKDTSDGYHTFGELYDYRRVFNAILFNQWSIDGEHDVHKSRKHSDGEPCFGGGWFIVVATLPSGQISNHYKDEFWDQFDIPERELPAPYDGHTPQIALERMLAMVTP